MSGRRLFLGARGRPGADAMAARVPGATPRRHLLAVLGVALLLSLLSGGVYWSLTTPRFVIRRIELAGFRQLLQDSLSMRLRGALGENIWRCDVGALADSLRARPWIADATIGRRPPGTLTARIEEWDALALLPDPTDSTHTCHLALLASGRLARLPGTGPLPDLPWLDGVSGDAAPDDLAPIVTLLQDAARIGMPEGTHVDFVVREDRGLCLVLGPDRQRLLMGDGSFAARLKRYRAVTDEVPPGAEVDLRFAGQVYIRDEG